MEGWRWVGLPLAALPLILIFTFGTIFGPGEDAANTVAARPPPFAFRLAWTIVVLTWGASIVLASLYLPMARLIASWVFSVLSLVICLLWLVYYDQNKYLASQILILLPLFAFAILVTYVGGGAELSWVMGLLVLPLCIWSFVALILGFLELEAP